MKNTLTLLFLLAYSITAQVHSQTVTVPYLLFMSQSSATKVSSILQKGDTIYVGGDFASIGYPDSVGKYGSPVNLTVGGPNLSWAKPNAEVRIAIPDGNGGFYIGGDFTMVGNQPRVRVAHLDQNGTVTSQLAGVSFNSWVNALAFKNGILYVGGLFSIAGDNSTSNISRSRLAAIDVSTGHITTWDPNCNSTVQSLAVYDTTVYVAGSFTNVGGAARNNFALLSAYTGMADSWNPGLDGTEVYGMSVAGDTLFFGGKFTTVFGQSRNKIAAIKGRTLLPWSADLGLGSQTVRAITVAGNLVYAGGNFDSVGGQVRRSIVALDRFTGVATAWNPAPPSGVIFNSIVVHNNIVYVAGNFINKSVGGQQRTHIVALDAAVDTLMALPWKSKVRDLYVNTLAVSGGTLYAGGAFTNMGGFDRARLAAFNVATGVICDWNPGADATVSLMALSHDKSTIYMSGGSLLNVGGVAVSRLAAVDANTGICKTTWLPGISSGAATAIACGPAGVYIGGSFTTISGQTRNRIAAVDPVTGAVLAWNPNASAAVGALVLKGDTLFAGGTFTTIGGQTRNRLAALNTSTGNATSFNPNLNGVVNTLALRDSTLYVGGAFTTVNSITTRNRLVALNTNTAAGILAWNPNASTASSAVTSLVSANNAVYAAGNFTTIGGITGRSYLAAIDATSGTVTASWNAASAASLTAAPAPITLVGNTVYASLGTATPYLVAITGDAALPVKFTAIKAVKQAGDVRISWRTASEINNSHFEVERSVDGISFQTLGMIRGAGNSTVEKAYDHLDRNAFAPGVTQVYYRVKQVDFDGRFSYSEQVQVSHDRLPKETSFIVYPNPAGNDAVIDFNNEEGVKTIAIFDATGNKRYDLESVNKEEHLNFSGYEPGLYFIRVTTAGHTETMRMVIAR